MKTVYDISGKPLSESEKWKLIDEHSKYLYASKSCLTTEEAYKEAVKKFCDYEEIAKLASLFDIVFD